MKKFIKGLAALMLVACGLVGLTSCDNYDFYKDWTDAGADLEKDAHIFEALTLEEAEKYILELERKYKLANKCFDLLIDLEKFINSLK